MKHGLVPLLLALYVKAAFSLTLLKYICPEAEDIEPCTCDDDISLTYTCRNVYNADTLRRAFQNAEGYYYDAISIENSTLQYIPHEIMEKTPARNLYLSDTLLIQIFDSPPQEVYSITNIRLDNMRVSRDISWSFFRGFINLEYFTVHRTPITNLGPSFSQYMSKELKGLQFSDSKISKIKPGALSGFSNLLHAAFENCSITILTRDIFPRPWKVSRLWLENNRITSIPEDLFTDMPNLHMLDLSRNFISVLPESAFQGSSIDFLILTGNPLKCDCQMRWPLNKELVKNYLGGICASPKQLEGKPIADLTLSDLYCSTVP